VYLNEIDTISLAGAAAALAKARIQGGARGNSQDH